MAQAALILVRHGRPAIDPATPSTTWSLCPEGRAGCEKLADRILDYAPTTIVSSPEPKALETAQVLAARAGLPVEVDPGLHEHKRHHLSFGTEEAFRQRIAAVFAKPSEPVGGQETAHEAAERLAAALARHQGAPLLAVTHGTVLSMYLGEKLDCDAHDLWRSLHMPDAFVLDAEGRLIERIS
ncbi:MAG: histidine phosphatase family protein [Phenylobacterium sp.]|uniref:histidine phosphatase family protein n=1 Tax=Phenylobacterium sp. TaxID=1871053 RepID=UPI001A50CD53|nr:histidine phosphatase family protein [Phenylobacterium sp.]MBL8771782.1 histidine phosphatase family protein [Phenylobacterium sp.]